MSRPRIELVNARLTHVGPIATRMREHDRIECQALGRTPKEGLRIGLRMSLRPLTVLVDGRPEGMMGAVPLSMIWGRAVAWMLGTPELYRHPRAWALLAPRVIEDMLGTFQSLENIVSLRNRSAIRFLTHMGFRFGDKVQERGGVEFVSFSLSRAIQAVETVA